MARKPQQPKPTRTPRTLSYERIRERVRRYPVWSARAVLTVSVVGIAIAGPLVLIFGHRRLLVQMELLLSIVAAAMFLFLAVGLYRGARVRKREDMIGQFTPISAGGNWGSFSGIGDITSGASGCGDIIAGIIFAIVVMVVLVIALWIFVNVALIVAFLLSIAVGWIFQRALRQVFAKSRICRGNLARSLSFAAFYTFLYTGWLFGILMLVDRLARHA